jgi:hypothetical protein
MKRFAFTCATILCSLGLASTLFAQARKAIPAKTTTASPVPTAAPPPVNKARMATPVKGTAWIEVIQGQPKRIGNDMVTVSKIKNVSSGPIAGLRLDEFWFDHKLQQVSADVERVRTPIAPGEVIEVTTRSPVKPDLYRSTTTYNHANGKVQAKGVKKFTENKE